MGIAWLWVVPLVLGWYQARTQSNRDPIRRALELVGDERIVRPSISVSESIEISNNELKAEVTATVTELPSEEQTPNEPAPLENSESTPKFICPDDQMPGPIYNYARSFSWCISTRKNLDPRPVVECNGMTPEVTRSVFGRMAISYTLAVLLHFSTTLMSAIIAYRTPTIGLGCRALGYIAVFSASLVSSSLLIVAALLQDFCIRDRGPVRKHLARASTTLRLMGKLIAYLGGLGFILHCLFASVGYYRECYCRSSYLGLVSKAYINFFPPEYEWAVSGNAWNGVVGVSFVFVGLFTLFCWLARFRWRDVTRLFQKL
jgi:hypothetical protein